MTVRCLAAACLLAVLPVVAFAQDAAMKGMSMPAASGMPAATSPATQAYMRAMSTMHEKMQAMTPANDPDKDFVMMMEPHHKSAVDMAQAYLKYGSDPMLKRMARNIIGSQNKEIAEMKAWTARHAK